MKINTLFIGDFPKKIIEEYKYISPFFLETKEIKENTEKTTKYLRNTEAIISRSGCLFEKSLLLKAPNLKLLIKAGAGIDMIDNNYCKENKIEISNTPGANAQSVAEIAIGLMIALSRKIIPLHHSIEQGFWSRGENIGSEIFNKSVSVIGYGYVGRRTVKLLKALGCSVKIYDPTLSEEEKDHAILDGCIIENCENCAIKNSDFIILHPSYNETSHNFINHKKIGKMKKGVKIINLSRGNVMEKEAVLLGLKKEIIGGIAIDAWWEEPIIDNPFKDYKNVIMTPHIGANTEEALERVTRNSIHKIEEFFKLNKNEF